MIRLNVEKSNKDKHRAVAPIIATLILVAIAVVGGIMVFVFAQDFFGGTEMTQTTSIEALSMTGYDFREGTLLAHDASAVTGAAGGNTGLNQGDEGLVYLKNGGTDDITITTVLLNDAALTFTASSCTLTGPNYAVWGLATAAAASNTCLANAILIPGQSASLVVSPGSAIPTGRTISVEILTAGGSSFDFSIVTGQRT